MPDTQSVFSRTESIAKDADSEQLKDLLNLSIEQYHNTSRRVHRAVIACILSIAIIESIRFAAGSEFQIGPLKVTDSSFAAVIAPAVVMLIWANMMMMWGLAILHRQFFSALFKQRFPEAYSKDIELMLNPPNWVTYLDIVDSWGNKLTKALTHTSAFVIVLVVMIGTPVHTAYTYIYSFDEPGAYGPIGFWVSVAVSTLLLLTGIAAPIFNSQTQSGV